MSDIEHADRGERSFPAHWGTPPGTPYSEERHRWIVQHVANAPRRARSAVAALAKVNELAVTNSRSPHIALVRALELKQPKTKTRSAYVALAKAMALGPGTGATRRASGPVSPALAARANPDATRPPTDSLESSLEVEARVRRAGRTYLRAMETSAREGLAQLDGDAR